MNPRNIILLLSLLTLSTGSFAAATGGGALPWEGGLTQLVNSFTGPVAYAVSVLGIVIAIGILIFGNDLNALGRTIVFLILAASVIVTAANTLTVFTGVGATTTSETVGMLGVFLALTVALSMLQESFLRLFRKRDEQSHQNTAEAVFAS